MAELWTTIQNTFSFGLASQLGEASVGCMLWYLAEKVVNWLSIIAGIVLLGYIIYGGIKYITSTGDPGKLEEAQKTIVNAIIGFAIVVLAWSITALVMHLFGVADECMNTSISEDEEEEETDDTKLPNGSPCNNSPSCLSNYCATDPDSSTGFSCQ